MRCSVALVGVVTGLVLGAWGVACAETVTITYDVSGVPEPIVGIALLDARGESTPTPTIADAGLPGQISVTGQVGWDSVVRLNLSSGVYLLDGPFRWPATAERRVLEYLPRLTTTGAMPEGTISDTPIWLDRSGLVSSTAWPRCGAEASRWRCVGIPVEEGGVVVIGRGRPIHVAHLPPRDLSRPAAGPMLYRFAWAGVVMVSGGGTADPVAPTVRVQASSAVALELTPVRLAPRAAAGCRSLTLAPTTLIVGCQSEQDVELVLSAARFATVHVPIDHLSASLFSPLVVPMEPERIVTGRVETADRLPAPATQIEVSELLTVTESDGDTRIVRRSVAAVEADAKGLFQVAGLRHGSYEALAAHASGGRATVQFDAGPRPVVIRLAPMRRVTGRVVRGGMPVLGAQVGLAPDLARVAQAADPFDLVAPATATGSDGRFDLALPPHDGGEIRIVADGAVVRVSVPVGGEVVQLGDVNLPAEIVVDVRYNGPEGCLLVGVGPFGRSGMSIVEAIDAGPGVRQLPLPEAGRWMLMARCGTRELPVRPAMVDVPGDVARWETGVTVAP